MKHIAPPAALIALIFVVAFYDEMRTLLLYAGLGLLALAGVVGVLAAVIGAGMGWEKWGTARAERIGKEADARRKEAEATKAEHEANIVVSGGDAWVREFIEYIENGILKTRTEYARLGGTRLRVNSHDHIPTESERLFASTLLTTGQTKMMTSGQILPQLPPAVDLLAILDDSERVLFEGPPDAGKTTLCLHVASRSQNVIIVDPHNEPGKWPGNAKIIGGGRNFVQIQKFVDWMIEELDRRAKMADSGNKEFTPITIIIDELPTLILNCGKEVSRSLAMMIIESRKFKFRIFIGAQSKLLKLLGLEGMGDVRKGLVMVHLGYDQITKQRVSKVDVGSGEQACYFPPFGAMSVTPDLVLSANEVIEAVGIDAQIIEMFQQHLPYKDISEAVWGEGKYGKFYNDKIDKILARYGIRA